MFFNFNPALHELALPAAWDIASPEQVLDARWSAMQAFADRIEVPVAGIEEATGWPRPPPATSTWPDAAAVQRGDRTARGSLRGLWRCSPPSVSTAATATWRC